MGGLAVPAAELGTECQRVVSEISSEPLAVVHNKQRLRGCKEKLSLLPSNICSRFEGVIQTRQSTNGVFHGILAVVTCGSVEGAKGNCAPCMRYTTCSLSYRNFRNVICYCILIGHCLSSMYPRSRITMSSRPSGSDGDEPK